MTTDEVSMNRLASTVHRLRHELDTSMAAADGRSR
jgi:hypothetical protein